MPLRRRLRRARLTFTLLTTPLLLAPAMAGAQPDPAEAAPPPATPAPLPDPQPPAESAPPSAEPAPAQPAPPPAEPAPPPATPAPAQPGPWPQGRSAPDWENPPHRRPEPPPIRFGLQGQTVLDTGLFFTLSRTTFRFNMDEASQTQFSLAPALGFFVREDFLIQLRVRWSHLSQDTDHETTFGLGGAVAFNVPASDHLSLSPTIAVMRLSTDSEVSGTDTSFTRLMATFSAYLLYHPTAHIFIGLGPSLSTSYRTRINGVEGLAVTVVGADGMIGAWW
jgi:hypothetical protein